MHNNAAEDKIEIEWKIYILFDENSLVAKTELTYIDDSCQDKLLMRSRVDVHSESAAANVLQKCKNN